MAEVRISDAAEADLKSISDYTTIQWGDQQKNVVLKQIRKTLEIIGAFPKLLTPTDKPGYFTKAVPRLPFVIVCRPEADFVVIMQILHDKQNRQ